MLILPVIFTGSSQLMIILPLILTECHIMMILPLIQIGFLADDDPSFEFHRIFSADDDHSFLTEIPYVAMHRNSKFAKSFRVKFLIYLTRLNLAFYWK